MDDSDKFFISWTQANGRTLDLSRRLGIRPVFVHSVSRLGVVGRYLQQYSETRRLLKQYRPSAVLVMLPPTPALICVLLHARPETTLLFDLHTGFFTDPRWRWASKLSLSLIRARGLAIVTNQYLASVCENSGVNATVLHDPIEVRGTAEACLGYVLCPLSYANDEPIDEILEAARISPTIEWKLTGHAPQRIRDQAPRNVTFTGFVPQDTFEELLSNCLAVLALTTRPHTMQRAGYEAFNFGVPLITSTFPELVDFFQDTACYSDPRPKSIAAAVREVIERRDLMLSELPTLRQQRIKEQSEAIHRVHKQLFLGG